MKKFFKNTYNKKQLENIKKIYKFIYIFHYNNISNNEIILIKKQLKIINLKIIILKNFIYNKIFLNIKLQGCLFILYNNNYINLIKILNIFKNFEFLLLKINKNFYSKLKLKKILFNFNKNININKIFFNFFIYFLKIFKNISL